MATINTFLLQRNTGGKAVGGAALLKACSISVTGTGNLTTGLTSIFSAVATVVNATALAGTVSGETVSATAITGGTVALQVLSFTTTPAVAVSLVAKTVHCIAVGY